MSQPPAPADPEPYLGLDDPKVQIALQNGRAAESAVAEVVELLQAAHKLGRGGYRLGGIFVQLVRWTYAARAYWRSRAARRRLAAFHKDLDQLGLRTKARLANPQMNLADALEGMLADQWLDAPILRSRTQANITLSRIRRVVRALEGKE